MSNEKKDYFIGVDMGTSSVGWAVTDTEYNLMRRKGKDLWGARLFPEASTSEGRRAQRTSRRNRQREQVRNSYLREMFKDEINKIDPEFFHRLDDSFLKSKDEKNGPTLFRNSDFTDKEYYEKYPTIFHLIKDLIENPKPHDARLVYLACLNIYKHRGHFLNPNLDGNGIGDAKELVDGLIDLFEGDKLEDIDRVELTNILKKVLPSKKIANSEKKDAIVEVLTLNDNDIKKRCTEIAKLLCGLKGSIQEALGKEIENDEDKLPTLSFRDGNYDEIEQKVESVLSEDEFQIFLKLKEIHDWGLISNLMMDDNGKVYPYISFSRVASYEKHEKDLKILKHLFKEYGNKASLDKNGNMIPSDYDSFFRIMNDNNYSWYSGSVNSKYGHVRRNSKGKVDDFFKQVKTKVESFPDCDEKAYVLSELERESFLPKQLTSSNGVIPYQLHLTELEKILSNASKYLSFLNDIDDSGLTTEKRIVEMFRFRVPYYVGPLFNNKEDNNFAWSIRKEDGRVLPWNFEEKIDIKKSSEEFIKRMVRHCTYISDEEVLPKNSLIYEKFMVLNELNNLKINGEKISIELKQKIYNKLLSKGKKTSKQNLINFLKAEGYIDATQEIEISGIDKTFNNSLKNHKLFKEIFGVDSLTDSQKEIAEKIIYWSTIYGDDKKFLKEQIIENYGATLNEAQINRILGVKFNDWGNLSKSFLLQLGSDKIDGEIKSIISRMWDENLNLMEILSEKYTYKKEIEEQTNMFNKDILEISFEDLNMPYVSNPVKRMIWQTVLIFKELYFVMGYAPTKVFIEMARSDEEKGEKGRKDSRKKNLERIYKTIKNEKRDWVKEISERDESEFRSKKLYLYYTQQGRCMYTGESIDLGDLLSGNTKYDIDHIYPRHFVKDDSIDNNLVLVNREVNNHKQDKFPIEESVQSKMEHYWSYLKAKGLITAEKYKRLTRKTEFANEELRDFINRQLTETQQGTKLFASIIKGAFPDCEIVYSKAKNISQFRDKKRLHKCREINDLHHASDAYLNIVVGNVYNTKFTKDPLKYINDEFRKNKDDYNMDKIFDFTVERNEIVAWDKEKSITTVKETLERQTPLVTYMSCEEHKKFWNENLVPRRSDSIYIPIKSKVESLQNTSKYGGYTGINVAYFFLVEHNLKGKKVRTIEVMPIYLKDELNSIEKVKEYCKNTLGYENPSIRVEKIKFYSKIKVNGFEAYITGKTGSGFYICNASQLKLESKWSNYVKRLSSLIDTNGFITIFDNGRTKITGFDNVMLYEILVNKLNNKIYVNKPNNLYKALFNSKEKFEKLSVLEQCKILIQIFTYFSRANNGIDLRLLNLPSQGGRMTINKNIIGNSEFKLINESVTGLFTNEVDLLTI